MKQLGLIGYPLSHSFSKKYFSEKFDTEQIEGFDYELFPIETIEKLTQLKADQNNLLGLNVTIPYKEQVIPFLDKLSDAAEKIGAVNTIKFQNGKLFGYNTDVIGFKNSLLPLLKTSHKKALILGTGGAAKAVAYVMEELKIDFKYVSRRPKTGQLTYEDLTQSVIEEYTLIINSTPLGTSPNVTQCPSIPYEFITEGHLLYDLVYNPSITAFMQKGLDKGAVAKNGLDMLIGQAEAAWSIWTDKP